MNIKEDDYLAHYGILRKSGRYPWGSGGTQSQRNKDFLGYVDDLRKQGMKETDIAKGMGISTTALRAARSIAKNSEKQGQINMAQRLKDKGASNVAIGQRMGLNESSVRALLAPGSKDKVDILQTTAQMLRDQVEEKRFVDIGSGVENQIGISGTKLATSVAILKEEGYEVHTVQVDQLGTGNKTLVKVLAPKGTTYRDIVANKDQIQQIQQHSEDGGRSFLGLHPPLNISSTRIGIRYAEDGGGDADGVIYVRPGIDDVSLGGKRYAQVRIAVDNTHYLKGMAMYKDDLPNGQDLVFNTNKSNTGNKLDAMKTLKSDPDNPFGSTVRQLTEKGPLGEVKRVTSVMNLVNEEGDWEKWSKSLSSQVLSKQSPTLARTQLEMTYESKKNDLDTILKLTNPAVRKKLLEGFADQTDSSAIHLKAAALPRQSTHVILPINTLKENEIYSPRHTNGETVALIRYPHGGTFEIPELVVNNRHPAAKVVLGDTQDAVGINAKVAKRLSGADFDGDTVLVIPQGAAGKLKTAPSLEKLKDFDPQAAYPGYEGMKQMTPKMKGLQMGDVSNLITDMTIKGANTDELARAVRHSMVVIDAEKHNLDYKQSSIDHGIPALKEKYQGRKNAGAATLISRATSQERVPERKPRSAANGGPIDKVTGKRVFEETGATFPVTTVSRRTGVATTREVPKTTRSVKLKETENAHTLSSGTPIEKVYADHSNKLKDLANTARRELVNTQTVPYSPSARLAYSKEVTSLNAKLNIALQNRPRERQAQLLANTLVASKKKSNPDMDPAELKKLKFQALAEARIRTGARKEQIDITDDEWKAIQAGAISNNKLTHILNNSNLDRVKELATPRTTVLMTSTKQSRANAMLASGYTQADVAAALGVSLTTLKNSLKGGS